MSLAIGVDLGGSTLRAALVDAAGKITRAVRRKLEERAPAAVLDQLERLVGDLGAREPDLPMAVGIAAFVRERGGFVVKAPNLGWREVPFGDLLAERFGRPVRLVNDLGAITVGEAHCGAGRGAADVTCVFVGTGVGMGAVVHGRLLEGYDGLATELGHIKVASPESGRHCGCGERGCLEAYTSGRHLPDLLAEKVAAGMPSPLFASVGDDLASLTAERIEAAANAGDAAAISLWSDVAERLGLAVGNVITLLAPRVLVLGGGVLLAAPALRYRVAARVRAHAGQPQLGDVELCDTALGDHAGLVGAGILAHQARR